VAGGASNIAAMKTLAADSGPSPFITQRHDWRLAEVEALFELPFMDLLFRAQQVHRAFHAPNRVQMSTLLSIKTGGCPEDCGYCPQSIHYDTGVARDDMLPVEQVVETARKAQAAGATRFCMGAAFRSPKKKDIERIATMIREVNALGLETCATLGMLTPDQAQEVHAFIRGKLAALDAAVAEKVQILYGGSMNPGNAAELLAMPDIDGGLIGGASLKPADFLAIGKAANA